MLDEYKNNVTQVRSITKVIDIYNKIIKEDYNVIFVSDIDDTIITTETKKKFVEPEVTNLFRQIYFNNNENLIFLTARDKDLKSYTRNELNNIGLIHDSKYIFYNIICSPYDDSGVATKGYELEKYFEKNPKHFSTNKPNWLIFLDDQLDQIYSVFKNCKIYTDKNINYTLLHYYR